MGILDRYVFGEWLKMFALTLGAILSLLLLVDWQDQLPEFRSHGVSHGQILAYYALKWPSFLPSVLPISLLVSLLYALSQLHRHQEITAMRAAGLSLWRVTRLIWLAALGLTGLLFWLNAEVVPQATEASRERALRLTSGPLDAEGLPVQGAETFERNLSFYNHAEGRLWFINRFDERSYRVFGLTVSELDAQGRELRRLAAREGYYDEPGEDWVLLEGRETLFDPASGDPLRSLAFDRRVLEDLSEDPELMRYLQRKPNALSFNELSALLFTLPLEGDPRMSRYAVQYFQMMLNPLSLLIVVGLAIPFAVAGVRTNPVVNISQSLALFVLYYLAVMIADLLGSRGLEPVVAALMPNLTMGGLALYLNFKATRPQ